MGIRLWQPLYVLRVDVLFRWPSSCHPDARCPPTSAVLFLSWGSQRVWRLTIEQDGPASFVALLRLAYGVTSFSSSFVLDTVGCLIGLYRERTKLICVLTRAIK